MTYAGHLVKNTLLRCRFSPRATTGQVSPPKPGMVALLLLSSAPYIQRYIYTGCAKGRVISENAYFYISHSHKHYYYYHKINVHTNPPPYIVYDVLTGEVVKRLGTDESQGVIRDVSWHPTSPGKLVASSVSHSHLYTCTLYSPLTPTPPLLVGWLPDTLEHEPNTSLCSMQTTQETIPLVAHIIMLIPCNHFCTLI